MKTNSLIAFDKSNTARRYDAQNFLHVEGCRISKATVNPYLGAEIPDGQQLGLDPQRTYQIFRDPEELAKAALTFNNLPLLDTHVEVGAVDLEDPEIKKHIVGSTGQCAEFKAPYLVNDLVIWTAGAIAGVESKEQTELSCAYRYKIDMTPGAYEGVQYDGRMTDIIGNHVALVEEGRAGHDVVVADSKATDVISQLTAVKKHVTDDLKPGAPEEGRKILDDLTGALDVALHHLLDYEEEFPDSITAVVETPAKPLIINVAMDVVRHVPGHKDSEGKAAPWVVRSEKDGSVLWSGKSKEDAVAALRNMKGHAAKDDNPTGANQYTGGSAGAASKAATKATAMHGGTPRGHMTAALAHQTAKAEHTKAASNAPDKATQAKHEQAASLHGQLAGYHGTQANLQKDTKLKIGAAGAEGGKAHDSKESLMAKNNKLKLTPQGNAVQGALLAYLRPRLAADAAVGPKEVAAILRNIEPERYKKQIPGIVGTVKERFGAKLAKDADLDIEELKDLLESLSEAGEEEDDMEEDAKVPCDEEMGEDADPCALLIKKLESLNLSPADMEEIGGYLAQISMPKAEPAVPDAVDEFPPKKEEEGILPPKKEGEAMQAPPITKPAMDAALKLVQAETRKETIADIGERYQAAEIVKPLIGKVDALAIDSAASIYKMALDAKGIKTEGVHPSAYKALVEMLNSKSDTLANDEALTSKADVAATFHEAFPNATCVGKA